MSYIHGGIRMSRIPLESQDFSLWAPPPLLGLFLRTWQTLNMLPVSLLTTLTLLACFFHSSIATSATTQQQLQEALRAAFGNTVQFSELLPPNNPSTTSGAKYIVDVSEKGIDTWTEAQIKTEQERNDVLPRLMTTYDGTQFRCAVPVPKMFLPLCSWRSR